MKTDSNGCPNQGSGKKGFTLVEVVVSLLVFFGIWMAAGAALSTSKYFSSLARHKIQAVYAAQQTLEEIRRWPFANLGLSPGNVGQGTAIAFFSTPIALDVLGTYNTQADDFQANRVVTVTDLNPVDPLRKKVLVEVNWPEQVLGGTVIMREYCATDIANEAQLN